MLSELPIRSFLPREILMLTFFVNRSPTFRYMEILITINRAHSQYRLVCYHFMHHFLVKIRTANQLIDEPPFCINLCFCFTLRSNLSLRCSLQHYYKHSVTAQVCIVLHHILALMFDFYAIIRMSYCNMLPLSKLSNLMSITD